MDKVKVAKSAGFCFGVKRAVNLVYDEADCGEGPIYTWGPIIHNDQVVADLAGKGVHILNEEDLTEGLPRQGSLIIRSHGVSRDVFDKLKKSGLKVKDATCPFVRKIHEIVQEHSQLGEHIIIIGNPNHPEVVGIRGWAEGPCDVISCEEDIKNLKVHPGSRICLVSQTTFNHEYFRKLVENVDCLGYDTIVLNTICNATKERQTEAEALAKESDIMLVVGSKSSSNTQKLYDICKAFCEDTYYIQTIDDLMTVHFCSDSRVGITAGASAPNNIIQEVFSYVRRN